MAAATALDAITGAAAVIPAAAAGVTSAVGNSKLGHVIAVVGSRQDLTAGTHISYKVKDALMNSYRHAIVSEDAAAESLKPIALIYWVDGRVVCEDVEIAIGSDETGSIPVFRHAYNPLICYKPSKVAARACVLSDGQFPVEKNATAPRSCWSCFRGDEDFAIWCQTGIRLKPFLKGIFSTDYKYTRISSVGSLRRGDHVSAERRGSLFYQHGIVVELNNVESDISVSSITDNVNCPEVITLQGSEFMPAKGGGRKLYRYDYDIALGHNGDTVAQAALNEAKPDSKKSTPPTYKNDVEFAVWCKLSTVISPNEASTLAKARVASCLRAVVETISEMNPGDHVDFCGQHVVVEEIATTRNGGQLTGIMMQSVELMAGSAGKKVCRTTFDKVNFSIGRKNVSKCFYDLNEPNKEDYKDILSRASEHLGKAVDELPFKDAQHFAAWCRTGLHQLHTAESTSSFRTEPESS